jgi:UDP-4-amino-4-deoxy-L-arabinose-oxoglutarate aminotransferase
MKIDFYRHRLSSADAVEIGKVLDSAFLTSGEVGKKVEGMINEFFGVKHTLLVNSWTNGALAALLAIGVKPGDEVIIPAMTFIATANMVELIGAKPVFVDVDPDTLLLEPQAIARAVTKKTKAVIPVHLYGQMCDMKAMRAALPKSVVIIEDCAHCFEGTRDGDAPAKHAEIAIFSFYATKNVTCGEGGAIITNSDELALKMSRTRLHGMSHGAADRFKKGNYRHWDMEQLGVKANLPDLLAALLPRQIADCRALLPKRQAVSSRYRAAFDDQPIRQAKILPGSNSAEHLYVIHVPGQVRDDAIAELNQRGVPVTVNYRSVPTLTYYREKYGYKPDSFPVSYEWGEGTISLPMYPDLPKEAQDHVIKAVLEGVVPLCRKAGRN